MSLSSGAIRRIAASERIPHELGGYDGELLRIGVLDVKRKPKTHFDIMIWIKREDV